MRYGVISDIHANLPALEAVLEALADQRVDGYLCPGDLVGYGPQPNECVQRVADLGAVCVAGNHDLIALGRLSEDRCIPLARRSLAWTRGVLSGDSRAYLSGLPGEAAVDGEVLIAHGAIGDPQHYVRSAADAVEQLRLMAGRGGDHRLLVLGHTHEPVAFGSRGGWQAIAADAPLALAGGETYLLNPGSVGQSRDRSPLARFAVLDLDRRRAAWHAVDYDVRSVRRALRREGLPARSVHLRPSAIRARAGALASLVRART